MFDSKEAVLYNRVGQYKMHPSDKNPNATMENDEGKFAFTTDANEVVNICFHSKASGWARGITSRLLYSYLPFDIKNQNFTKSA